MLNTSLAPWPSFTPDEVAAVADVLASNKVNYWTGDEGRTFESEFAAWSDTRHAIALANGTLALDLALQGCGIGPGDDVVVTPRTFIASVSCVINAGANPVYADVDHDSGNISAATIERVLTPATKAIIPVHLAGWPCDMHEINAVAEQRGAMVIEDCAQAHGATIDGRSVGSFGAIGAWSFCQDKIMTTGGEGGMVTTNDEAMWDRMWSFKDHGKSFDAVYRRQHAPGFRWLHETIGTNWRMLEMQAVLGRLQLRKLAGWVDRRRAIATRISEALNEFADLIRVPVPPPGYRHAYYRLYGYVRPEALAADWTRDRIVAEVMQAEVPIFQGSCSEVYLERAFDGHPSRPATPMPVARELGQTSLMFLTHPTITDDQVGRVVDVVTTVLKQARR